MELLRYLISSAHGGYESVYIPYVYASSSAAYSSGENVLDKLRFAEENFTSDELMLDEVLTYLMQFFRGRCMITKAACISSMRTIPVSIASIMRHWHLIQWSR